MGLKAVISRQMKPAVMMMDAQGRGHEQAQDLYLLFCHMWRTLEIVNRTAKAVETPFTGSGRNPVTSEL
jgi:hypothetical protein